MDFWKIFNIVVIPISVFAGALLKDQILPFLLERLKRKKPEDEIEIYERALKMADNATKRMEILERQINEHDSTIALLKGEVREKVRENEVLKSQLSVMENENNALKGQVIKLEAENTGFRSELQAIKGILQEAKRLLLGEQTEDLKKLLHT